jgi:hypothetical protein
VCGGGGCMLLVLLWGMELSSGGEVGAVWRYVVAGALGCKWFSRRCMVLVLLNLSIGAKLGVV